MKADMRHFKVSDKLSEVCRHSISALRRTVRLCNKELIIIVHPTARLGQSLLPRNQIKLPQEIRQCCSFSDGGSHGAPAVRLGAKGTYPICPILRRRPPYGLSLSRIIRHFRVIAGKGVSHFQPEADIVNPISY